MPVTYITCMKESVRMPEKSELEPETTKVAGETSSEEVQREYPEAGIYKEREDIALQVYHRREKITKVVRVVVEQELDERIQKMESMMGKYDSASLIDTDLMDSFQFPAMKKQV